MEVEVGNGVERGKEGWISERQAPTERSDNERSGLSGVQTASRSR